MLAVREVASQGVPPTHASLKTARADQKYYDDLDAGIPEPEAFRRHKNRFRALTHAFRTGKAVPPTPKGRRSDGQLPPIQSRDAGPGSTGEFTPRPRKTTRPSTSSS